MTAPELVEQLKPSEYERDRLPVQVKDDDGRYREVSHVTNDYGRPVIHLKPVE